MKKPNPNLKKPSSSVYFSGTIPQRAALLRFAKQVCVRVPALRGREINVIFVTDRGIHKINRQFLQHDYATDVITFHYPMSRDVDIYISVDTAKRAAKLGNYDAHQELALLICHGLLHVSGYDDHTPRDRARMFARQTQLLRALAPKLAPPDFR